MASPFTARMEVGLLYLAETMYVYYLVLRLRKGLPRLLALLPLIPLSFVVVWRAPTAFERTVYCSFFLWMLIVKLVLLAFDKGLADDPYALSSFPRFVYAVQSPVHLPLDPQVAKERIAKKPQFVKDKSSKKRSDESAVAVSNPRKKSRAGDGDGMKTNQEGGNESEDVVEVEMRGFSRPKLIRMMATSQALHLVIFRCVVYYIVTTSLLRILLKSTDLESEYVTDLLLGFFTYFWFLLFFEVVIVLPASMVGTELQPVFDNPFWSDSLGDFWGQRWNLIVINLLRVSVYEPMLRMRGRKSSIFGRGICTGTTFLVSGLMHELILFCASRIWPSWEITTFFVVNGVGTIVERCIKARYRFPVPRLLRTGYTLTFVYFTAHWFLIPSLKRHGLLDGMADLRNSIDGIENMMWVH
ncbi:unnamed protein product [Calypogeia fissa]